MKLAFHLDCRLALGRQLPRILEVCRATPLLAPQAMLLTSRQRRADLAEDEVLRSAAASASDSVEIVTPRGSVSAHWLYGPRRSVPRLWGVLTLEPGEIPELVEGFKGFCTAAGGTYGLADLTSNLSERTTKPDVYGKGDVWHALRRLYWLNYFGPEVAATLEVSDGVRALARPEEMVNGGLLVVTRDNPEAPADATRLAALGKEWPVFRDYGPKASLPKAVRIDYADVWAASGARQPDRVTPASFVGRPDEFIAGVEAHARRFHEWARARGLALADEADFQEVFQQHEQVIRDELLVPAIAAYGEMLRAQTGAVWTTGSLLHRGEPVLAKPGRPWTARRVIVEVLEGLEEPET